MDGLCINTIRTLAMDAVQQANSGHPGTPMALAPVVYCLWQRFLRFDPTDPIWPNRDRFMLSAGHASMLLYSPSTSCSRRWRNRVEAQGRKGQSQTYALPEPVTAALKGSLTEWRAQGKARRLWGGDSSQWTGRDEAQWLGWLASPTGNSPTSNA
jgi:hypothetical protein